MSNVVGMLKSGLVFCLLAAVVAVSLTGAFVASADNDDDNIEELLEGKGHFKFDKFPPGLAKKNEVRSPTLNINPHGKVLITSGEVTEASWPNLKVKVWGLILNVHVMPDAVILGASGSISTSTASTTAPVSVSAGDKVDVLGEIEASTGLIHARHFKNLSHTNQQIDSLREQIRKLMEEIEKLKKQLKELR